MKNLSSAVSLRPAASTGLGQALVESVSGRDVLIRIEGETLEARLAFSCLVQPRPGDRVLCAVDESGDRFVLAIIDRPGGQDLTMAFPADASLVAEDGNLGLLAQQSVTLAAGENLNSMSGRAVHKSREAVVDYGRATVTGETLQMNFRTITVISRVLNTMARQAVEKFMTYLRRTEMNDQVGAAQMSRQVDGLYSVNTNHTVMVSKKETKIDGERIFMG